MHLMKELQKERRLVSDLFGGNEVMALSWKQPFAELMLHGKIETRTWFTNYRGLVLICASKQPYHQEVYGSISGPEQYKRIWNTLGNPDECITGNAIAVGRLINCYPMRKEDEDKCFVEYYPGRYCHVYDDVKAIKPFPWKGSQGWRKVSQEIIDQIEYL